MVRPFSDSKPIRPPVWSAAMAAGAAVLALVAVAVHQGRDPLPVSLPGVVQRPKAPAPPQQSAWISPLSRQCGVQDRTLRQRLQALQRDLPSRTRRVSIDPSNYGERTTRDAYGNNTLGQGCLLARRLVQSGARYVEVTHGGWDMHQDLYSRLDERAGQLDTALGILLKDLHQSGLLDETLVVLTTEFGRKPEINANAGRDHHPGAFCSLLMGAGIRGGQVYGASDSKGFSVDKDHVSVSDFNKTIAAAAGLPLEKEQYAPNGRPFKIGGNGDPVTAPLA